MEISFVLVNRKIMYELYIAMKSCTVNINLILSNTILRSDQNVFNH